MNISEYWIAHIRTMSFFCISCLHMWYADEPPNKCESPVLDTFITSCLLLKCIEILTQNWAVAKRVSAAPQNFASHLSRLILKYLLLEVMIFLAEGAVAKPNPSPCKKMLVLGTLP